MTTGSKRWGGRADAPPHTPIFCARLLLPVRPGYAMQPAVVLACSHTAATVCCLTDVGEVQRSKQTDKYVRRRQRQNVTVGGQPATPLEAVWAEVLVVKVLGHFLEILHVGSDGWRAGSHGYVSLRVSRCLQWIDCWSTVKVENLFFFFKYSFFMWVEVEYTWTPRTSYF